MHYQNYIKIIISLYGISEMNLVSIKIQNKIFNVRFFSHIPRVLELLRT